MLIVFYNGERKNQVIQKQIDEVARMWNKTRSPKYKEKWYKLVREFYNGKNINNFDTSIQRNFNKRNIHIRKTHESS